MFLKLCLFFAALVFVVVYWLSLVVVSRATPRLWHTDFSLRRFSCCGAWALGCAGCSCGARAWLLQGLAAPRCEILDPGPGIKPEFRILAGRFPTTRPPGKSQQIIIEYPQWLGLRGLVPCSRCKAT